MEQQGFLRIVQHHIFCWLGFRGGAGVFILYIDGHRMVVRSYHHSQQLLVNQYCHYVFFTHFTAPIGTHYSLFPLLGEPLPFFFSAELFLGIDLYPHILWQCPQKKREYLLLCPHKAKQLIVNVYKVLSTSPKKTCKRLQ